VLQAFVILISLTDWDNLEGFHERKGFCRRLEVSGRNQRKEKDFMGAELFIEYLWVLVVLVGLEGLLAADNALVLAIMVRHLPEDKRRKALFYGLAGAFVLRFGSLFIISFLVDVWQVQALGAIYLLFISGKNLYERFKPRKETDKKGTNDKAKGSGFWMTVVKVEFADLAFAVDSILAAVALAVALPPTGLGHIGSLDTGQFLVVFAGGMIGLIIMRFAANIFVELLNKRPGLEVAAFVIVGWVGIKLSMIVLAHEEIGLIPEGFPHSTLWKTTFYIVLVGIAIIGWFASNTSKKKTKDRS
jgi:YkoY family integral membrane protein